MFSPQLLKWAMQIYLLGLPDPRAPIVIPKVISGTLVSDGSLHQRTSTRRSLEKDSTFLLVALSQGISFPKLMMILIEARAKPVLSMNSPPDHIIPE